MKTDSFVQVLDFLERSVELCQPTVIHICDGSEEENRSMIQALVEDGIVQPLTKYKNWLSNFAHFLFDISMSHNAT